MKYIVLFFLIMGWALTESNGLNAQTRSDLPGLLVTTAWLEENLDDPLMVILHYGKPSDFEEGHIPGARLVSMGGLMVDHPLGPGHELPDSASIGQVLRSWGINNNSKIIICYGDENGISMAARLFFTLDYAGLGNQTALLNGGLPAWKNEGRELTEATTEFEKGELRVGINEEILAHKKEVQDNLDNKGMTIIDARPEAQYSGKARDLNSKRKGHIPGAVNIPVSRLIQEEAPDRFKTDQELQKIFLESGCQAGSKVIVYCGSGIWASQLYFMARLLGYKASLYDGSMQEWGNDPSLPLMKDK